MKAASLATILNNSKRIWSTISIAISTTKMAKGEMTTSNGIEGISHFNPANNNEDSRATPKPTLSISTLVDYSIILVLIEVVWHLKCEMKAERVSSFDDPAGKYNVCSPFVTIRAPTKASVETMNSLPLLVLIVNVAGVLDSVVGMTFLERARLREISRSQTRQTVRT